MPVTYRIKYSENMTDIFDQHWTERRCKDNCGMCVAGCFMVFYIYPTKSVGCIFYLIGSSMIFAAFWQTEWMCKLPMTPGLGWAVHFQDRPLSLLWAVYFSTDSVHKITKQNFRFQSSQKFVYTGGKQ